MRMLSILVFAFSFSVFSNSAFGDADLKKQLEDLDKQSSTFDNELKKAELALKLFQLATDETDEDLYLQKGKEAAKKAYDQKSESVEAVMLMFAHEANYAARHKFTAGLAARKFKPWLLEAVKIDPKYDHGGPHRALGLFCLDAPGFLGGDTAEAKEHLKKMMEIDPDYPSNKLAWAEYLIEEGDNNEKDEAKKIAAEVKAVVNDPANKFEKKDLLKRLKERF